MQWRPIEDAPKNGAPVWVKGRDFGNPDGKEHCLWAYYNEGWKSADVESSDLLYLTHYSQL